MPRSVTDNIHDVLTRIKAAEKHTARMSDPVRLIAVTKYVGLNEILDVLKTGIFDLGESRPQRLWQMQQEIEAAAPELAKKIRWHLIGHLQTNKVTETLQCVEWIHSGDRLCVLEAIHKQSIKINRRTKILLEVNISGDSTKHGFRPDELDASFLTRLASLAGIEVRGLMGMSGLKSGNEQRREEFASLRKLRDQLHSIAPAHIHLDELSMGMSEDYEIGVEEGATMVRVGSALFE